MAKHEQKKISNMGTIKLSNLIDRVEKTEEKYGPKIAAWSIVAMIVYLVIAQ